MSRMVGASRCPSASMTTGAGGLPETWTQVTGVTRRGTSRDGARWCDRPVRAGASDTMRRSCEAGGHEPQSDTKGPWRSICGQGSRRRQRASSTLLPVRSRGPRGSDDAAPQHSPGVGLGPSTGPSLLEKQVWRQSIISSRPTLYRSPRGAHHDHLSASDGGSSWSRDRRDESLQTIARGAWDSSLATPTRASSLREARASGRRCPAEEAAAKRALAQGSISCRSGTGAQAR